MSRCLRGTVSIIMLNDRYTTQYYKCCSCHVKWGSTCTALYLPEHCILCCWACSPTSYWSNYTFFAISNSLFSCVKSFLLSSRVLCNDVRLPILAVESLNNKFTVFAIFWNIENNAPRIKFLWWHWFQPYVSVVFFVYCTYIIYWPL